MSSISFGLTSAVSSALSSTLARCSLQGTAVLVNITLATHHAHTHLWDLGCAGRVEDVCGLSPWTTFSSNRLRSLAPDTQVRSQPPLVKGDLACNTCGSTCSLRGSFGRAC